MSSNNRINITVEAMKLFLQSLPADCKFGIIGFGSDYYTKWDYSISDYNDKTKNKAINQIQNMKADYGGTDMLKPL